MTPQVTASHHDFAVSLGEDVVELGGLAPPPPFLPASWWQELTTRIRQKIADATENPVLWRIKWIMPKGLSQYRTAGRRAVIRGTFVMPVASSPAVGSTRSRPA
jgi:hypothetical protein